MSRKITSYRRPPIATLIATAANIDVLVKLRGDLSKMNAAGKIEASDRTLRAWREALWLRVIELIAQARTGEACSYIYNVTLGWERPPELVVVFEQIFAKALARMPSLAERLTAQGIEIDGITSQKKFTPPPLVVRPPLNTTCCAMTILEAERIRIRFGQYSGRTLAEIAADDVLYLDWLAGLGTLDTYLTEAVGVLVEKHARAIDKAMGAGGRSHSAAQQDDREKQGRLF